MDKENMWANNRHVGMISIKPKEEPDYNQYVRTAKDFPKKGINFYDITPLLQNGKVFNEIVNKIAWQYLNEVDSVVCIEARGFLIGAPVAYFLESSLIPIRKQGKLPAKTHKISYNLEYGTDTLEIHSDAIKPNDRVLIVDDVLATGGTAKAVVDMIRQLKGNVVGCAFLGEISELNGKSKLDIPVYSVIKF